MLLLKQNANDISTLGKNLPEGIVITFGKIVCLADGWGCGRPTLDVKPFGKNYSFFIFDISHYNGIRSLLVPFGDLIDAQIVCC